MSQSVSTAAVEKVATVRWLPLLAVVFTQIQASFALRHRKRVLDETDATPPAWTSPSRSPNTRRTRSQKRPSSP